MIRIAPTVLFVPKVEAVPVVLVFLTIILYSERVSGIEGSIEDLQGGCRDIGDNRRGSQTNARKDQQEKTESPHGSHAHQR